MLEGTYHDQAWLYDLAFSWDVRDEVRWLCERFGGDARLLLEPGCGSGRLMPDFARRGVQLIGLDSSATMLDRAATRMREAGLPEPITVCADMRDFTLEGLATPGGGVDGALCPVQTLAHLTRRDDARRHLEAVRRCLRPGGRYLVQLGLERVDGFEVRAPDEHNQWISERDGLAVRTTWCGVDFDLESRIQTEVCRFEIVKGPDAGARYEQHHAMRVWEWSDWLEVVSSAGFREIAAWDGALDDRPRIEPGPELDGRILVWHELVPEDAAQS
jgi:SAM-dependent methyltransferase